METGIKNNLSFVLTENAPILSFKGSKVEDSGKKLVKGTVINGLLKTRVVNINGEKVAYKFIESNEELFKTEDDEFEIYTNYMDSHIWFNSEKVQIQFERL